ncbi:MAG: DUF423 domain-containing protein [Pirellulales bacterium]
MKPNTWIACGALLAGLAVAAGAFGAHGLTAKLKEDNSLSREVAERRLENFQIGARYHMYHALAMVVVGLVRRQSSSPCQTAAGFLFLAGIALFCGGLYALALGGPRELGKFVVPFGGAGFIAGWICLAVSAWRADDV